MYLCTSEIALQKKTYTTFFFHELPGGVREGPYKTPICSDSGSPLGCTNSLNKRLFEICSLSIIILNKYGFPLSHTNYTNRYCAIHVIHELCTHFIEGVNKLGSITQCIVDVTNIYIYIPCVIHENVHNYKTPNNISREKLVPIHT